MRVLYHPIWGMYFLTLQFSKIESLKKITTLVYACHTIQYGEYIFGHIDS